MPQVKVENCNNNVCNTVELTMTNLSSKVSSNVITINSKKRQLQTAAATG